MTDTSDPFHPADEAILEYLAEERPDYVPLVANRLGLHLAYAESRFERLEASGYVEPVSEEVVYRITERGERALEALRASGVDGAPGDVDGGAEASARPTTD